MGRLFIQETAIIIQGPIRVPFETLEREWEGFNIIWSTWVGEHINSVNPVIMGMPPKERGIMNLGLQVNSTMSGLHYAKSLGYKYALKWRSDQVPNNTRQLMSLMDDSKMNVFYWCNCDGGYYTDYFMYGNIDDMISVWNIKNVNDYKFPELAITEQLNNHPVNCIGDGITESNNVYWHKNGRQTKLSSYKSTGNFEVRNK